MPDALPIGEGVCGAKRLPSFDGVPKDDAPSPKLWLLESTPPIEPRRGDDSLPRLYPEPSLYANGDPAGLLPLLPGVPLLGVTERV